MVQGFTRVGGVIFDAAIRLWLRLLGKRVDIASMPWIAGATGIAPAIGPDVYSGVARQMGLELRPGAAGLMPSFESLRGPSFDPDRVDPTVADFYERTSAWKLDAWAEWSRTFRPLAGILVGLISRRVDQLNLPLRAMDTAAGVHSDVLPLFDPSGEQRASGWLRRLKENDRVIYAGIYQIIEIPGFDGPVVKVVFPLPRGNVAAILRPEARDDGSFALVSDGRRFGEPGMYRSLVVGHEGRKRRVRYIRAMHEEIHVYVDDEGVLRTTHNFSFFKHRMLRIHYRMVAPDREDLSS